MTRKRTMTTRLVIGWLLLVGATPSYPEIAIEPIALNQNVDFIIMGIIGETPEPFGWRFWAGYRNLDLQLVLNAGGEIRGDGRPDVAWDPTTDWPVVVWAYNAGTDHDIAFSQWNGSNWTPVEFLTSSTVDETDPRVFVDSGGSMWVTWWRAGAIDRVYVSTRAAGSSTWGPAAPVTAVDESGRRPSVAMWNGQLYVAYERASSTAGMAQEVVVAHPEQDAGMVTDVVGQTDRTAPLDAVLHVENGLLWVDWKQGAADMGFAQAGNGGWTAPAVAARPDPSWVGEEGARRQIRRSVLSGP